MASLRKGRPFGPQALGPYVSAVEFEGSAGTLTGLLAQPAGMAKASVLMVPGFTGSKEDFIPILTRLAERGYRVLAMSQRGQADSDAAPSYELDDFVEDVLLAAETLGVDPVHLLGHSLGGVVARAAVVHRPQAFTSLVALCSGPRPIPHSDDAQMAVEALKRHGGVALFEAQFPGQSGVEQSDPFLEMLRLRALRSDPQQLVAVAEILGSFEDLTAALKATQIPVLLLGGQADDVWPKAYSDEEGLELGVPVIRIPNAGHSAQQDQPEAVVTALETFWENND